MNTLLAEQRKWHMHKIVGAMKLEANMITTSKFESLKVQLHVADLHTTGKHLPPVSDI